MHLKPKANTILEVLLSLEDCTRFGARFVARSDGQGEDPFFSYQEVLRRAKAVAGTFQEMGLEQGDRVAIVLPTSIHFLDIYLGTQLAGGIPAALYPPVRLGKLEEYFLRTRRMLNKIGARFLVTDSRIKKILGPATTGVTNLDRVLQAEKLQTDATWSPVEVAPDSPAFLQFSSGSTSADPKAVMVSHTNLLHNLEMMESVFKEYTDTHPEYEECGGVCWLPLYHDMGLGQVVCLGEFRHTSHFLFRSRQVAQGRL